MTIGHLRRVIARQEKYRSQLIEELHRDAVVPEGVDAPPFDDQERNRALLLDLNVLLQQKQSLMAANIATMVTIDGEELSLYQARLKAEALRQLANQWENIAKEGVGPRGRPWIEAPEKPPVRQVSITTARQHAHNLMTWADKISDAIEWANWHSNVSIPEPNTEA